MDLLSKQSSWDKINEILWGEGAENHEFPQDYIEAIQSRRIKTGTQCGNSAYYLNVNSGDYEKTYVYGTGQIYDYTYESGAPIPAKNSVAIYVAEGITGLGEYTFDVASCNARILDLPDSLISLDDNSLYGFKNISEFFIGKNLTSIGDNNFTGWLSLETIDVDSENTMFKSDDGVLFYKFTNSLIRYPAAKTGETYTIPSTITQMSISAFCENPYLVTVNLSEKLTQIPSWCFGRCANLQNCIIPEKVKQIRSYAFAETSLTTVSIPSAVTTIGQSAFNKCKGLAEVVMNSTTPPTLGSGVFYGCSSSLKIKVPAGSLEAYKTAANWSAYADIIEEVS